MTDVAQQEIHLQWIVEALTHFQREKNTILLSKSVMSVGLFTMF